MAETETAFNPLESNTQEFPEVIGIKRPGAPMETHEATFAESHLIELDLEKYVDDFNGRVIGAYQEGKASAELPADLGVARSLIPAGTGALRDFSYIAPEIPRFDLEKCVGCMSCVTLCPDTAILGKAIPASKVELHSKTSKIAVSGHGLVRTGRIRANILICRKRKETKARCSGYLSIRPSVKAAPNACKFATSWITTRSRW